MSLRSAVGLAALVVIATGCGRCLVEHTIDYTVNKVDPPQRGAPPPPPPEAAPPPPPQDPVPGLPPRR
ncbi:MAG TPA: hypothetical protein VGM56_26540 [Byssovorax sp.]|jgi:hypothetical protein